MEELKLPQKQPKRINPHKRAFMFAGVAVALIIAGYALSSFADSLAEESRNSSDGVATYVVDEANSCEWRGENIVSGTDALPQYSDPFKVRKQDETALFREAAADRKCLFKID